MRKEIADALAECHTPTKATKIDINTQGLPILRLSAKVQQQVAHVRELLLVAELSEGGADDRGNLERIHQTIDALEADAKAIITAGRRLSVGMEQLNRYGRDLEQKYKAP